MSESLLNRFREADKKVDEIEENGGVYLGEGYSGARTTKEYDDALAESQEVYNLLIEKGIDPFSAENQEKN